MELIDVLDRLKSEGHPVKFDHRRNKLVLGSWKKCYRLEITKNLVNDTFITKTGQNVLFTIFMAGILFNNLYGIWQGNLDNLAKLLFSIIFLGVMCLIIFTNIKERKIKKEIDQRLKDLQSSDNKAESHFSPNL